MKKIIYVAITTMTLCIMPAMAQNKFNSEIGCGVKLISRICPTYMWDSWNFEKIVYNANDSYVLFVIQGPQWSEPVTFEQKNKTANWIVNEFLDAYKGNIYEHTLCGDGDFMLYLALGNLLHKMASNDISLHISIRANKDVESSKDLLLKISSQQLYKLIK